MQNTSKTCGCGLTYLVGDDSNEKHHVGYHDECFCGPVIPEIAQIPISGVIQELTLHVMDGHVSPQIREAIAKVAEVANRSMSACKFGYYGSKTEEHVRMYLLASNERVVGMAMVAQGMHFWSFKWQSEEQLKLDSDLPTSGERVVIARLWVANNFRKRGLACALVRFVCEHRRTDITSIGWELPLTRLGAKIVQALCPISFFGSGDIHALHNPIE